MVARRTTGLSWVAVVLVVALMCTDEVDAKKKKKKKHDASDFVINDSDMLKPEKTKKLKVGSKFKKSAFTIEEDLHKVRKEEDPLVRIDELNMLVIQKPKVAPYWLLRGEAKQEKEFLKEALADFDKTVELDPDFENAGKMAMLHKGQILLKVGKLVESEKTLTTVMQEVDTSFPEAMGLRGQVYFKQGKYNAAVDQLDSVISIDSDSTEIAGWAYRWRAEAKLKQDDYVGGLDDYDKCIETWDALAKLTRSNAINATLTQRELRTIVFNRADLRCAGFCGGENAAKVQKVLKPKLEEAIKDFGYVMTHPLTQEGSTNHAVAAARIGLAYLKMDENVKAAEVLSEALKGAPDEASWVLNRGLAYARVDDYKGAIADYSKALDLAPNNNQAYNNRGIIYQRRRMYETAIEDFIKAQVKFSLAIIILCAYMYNCSDN